MVDNAQRRTRRAQFGEPVAAELVGLLGDQTLQFGTDHLALLAQRRGHQRHQVAAGDRPASVPAIVSDSSSGCAWTASRRRGTSAA